LFADFVNFKSWVHTANDVNKASQPLVVAELARPLLRLTIQVDQHKFSYWLRDFLLITFLPKSAIKFCQADTRPSGWRPFYDLWIQNCQKWDVWCWGMRPPHFSSSNGI